MRVDKDDRYMSEPPKNSSAPSLKLKAPNLQGLSKPKLIILFLVVLILLLILSLVVFRSPHKEEVTSLTPNTVNGVSSTDVNNTTEGGNIGNTGTTGSIDPTAQNSSQTNNAQVIEPAPISRTPTETQFQTPPVQERLEIPGDITDELNERVKQKITPEVRPKPVVTPPKIDHPATVTTKPKTVATNVNTTNAAMPNKIADNHFSIQLNASSSVDSLKSFVTQNQITHYQIYETKRNNKPWFVLIKGNYASANEAREAIKSLPSVLQKNNPWIKSGATINQEKNTK